MALFFYEQWTCSLKNVMVLALGMDSKRLKSTFFFFEWILKLSVLRKVWLFFKKRKIKDMGELLAVAMSRGKCHEEKIWAVLASRLTASASGCSSKACQHKRQGGPETQSLILLSLWGCWTQGAVWGHIWDIMDRLDLDSTTVLGQYFLVAMALRTALTGSNMAWTKSEWDNNDYILCCLFFCFLFISMF